MQQFVTFSRLRIVGFNFFLWHIELYAVNFYFNRCYYCVTNFFIIKKFILFFVGTLCCCALATAQEVATLFYSQTGMQSHWGEMTAVTEGGDAVDSGTTVGTGTKITFIVPSCVGYYVDWVCRRRKE